MEYFGTCVLNDLGTYLGTLDSVSVCTPLSAPGGPLLLSRSLYLSSAGSSFTRRVSERVGT